MNQEESSTSKYFVYLNEFVPHTVQEICSLLCKIINIRLRQRFSKLSPISPEKVSEKDVRSKILNLALKYGFLISDDPEIEKSLCKLLECFIIFVPFQTEDEPKDHELIKLCNQYKQLINDEHPILSFGVSSVKLSKEEYNLIICSRFNMIVDNLYKSRLVGSYHFVPKIMRYFSLFEWPQGVAPEALEVCWFPPKYENNFECIDNVNRPIGITNENLDLLLMAEGEGHHLSSEGNDFIRLSSAIMAKNGFIDLHSQPSSRTLTSACCFLYGVGTYLGYKFKPISGLNGGQFSGKEKQRKIRDNFKHLIIKQLESSK